MKKYLLKTLLVFLTAHCFAQGGGKSIQYSGGLIYEKNFAAHVSAMFASYGYTTGFYGMAGVGLGSEFVFTPTGTIVAPKLSCQIASYFVCFRLSEINYLHHNSVDVRLLPEIGIDFILIANLCYGYNIHLGGDKLTDISNHRVALTFNLFGPFKRKGRG